MKAKISGNSQIPKFDNIVIDGRNQVFKYQYTMKYLKNKKGVETGIYHGFLSLILKLKMENINARIIIAWEGGGLVRKRQLSTYKDGRPENKDSFESKIKNLKDMLGMLGVKQVFAPGYEADDVSAIITSKNLSKKTLLVTEDRDWFQAMNKNTYVMRNKGNVYSYEEIKKQEGFSPENYGLYVLLKGKKGNNVRGISGFPTKLAIEIVNNISSLKQLLSYKDVNNQKWIHKIQDNKKELQEKYDIVRLRNNIKMEDVKCHDTNYSHLKKLLNELEMFKVLNMMKMVKRLKKYR